MVKCSSATTYCCSQNPANLTCCNDADLVFTIDISAVINSYSASAVPTASSVGLAPIPSGHFDNPTTTGTSTAASMTSQADSTLATSAPPSSSETGNTQIIGAHTKTIAIAVGVAIPVIIMSILLATCIFFERRRRKERFLLGQRYPGQRGHSSNASGPFSSSSLRSKKKSSRSSSKKKKKKPQAPSATGPPTYMGNSTYTVSVAKGDKQQQMAELAGSSKGGTDVIHEVPG